MDLEKQKQLLSKNNKTYKMFDGHRIFILGTGPSIQGLDLRFLKAENTISLAQFGKHPDIESISPDFHLIADPEAFNPNEAILYNKTLSTLSPFKDSKTTLVFPYPYAKYTTHAEDYKDFNINYYSYDFKYSINKKINLNTPGPAWGQNVINSAIMYAIHLGCKEIYLVGVDNAGIVDFNDPIHDHFYHGDKDFEKILRTKLPEEELKRCIYVHLDQLHQIKRYCHKFGHKIFTCSPQGSFKMFPYARYSSLFREQIISSCQKAQFLLKQGKTQVALQELSKWEKLGEYPQNYFNLFAKIYTANGLQKKANECRKRELHFNPSSPTERFTLSFEQSEIPINLQTVSGVVGNLAKESPASECVSVLNNGHWQVLSRAEFWEKVNEYAILFASYCKPNTLLLFIKKTDIDLLAAYIGAMHAGLQPAQISPFTTKTSKTEYRRKINHILSITKASFVFTDQSSKEYLADTQVNLLFPDSSKGSLTHSIEYSDTALAQFSSGSTGLQKAVFLKHSGIIAHMDSYARSLKLSEQDRLVSWLPLYHDMGLIACYLMPLMKGVPFMIMDAFDWLVNPQILLDTITQNKATLCYLPNFAYHLLAKKCQPTDLSSMRAFVNCSEPAKWETHQIFAGKFPSVKPEALSVCYALAENTYAVSQTDLNKPPAVFKLGQQNLLSCGSIIDNTQVRICEADENGIGEVHIAGDCLFDRFLDNENRLVEGYYPTGDLGFIQNNELYITGRKKDLIIVNGKNIYPQDVEYVASNVEGVYPGRVVCFGVENSTIGSEELIIQVEPQQDNSDIQKIMLDVQRAVELETGLLPALVEIVPYMSLVKTSSGKISRSRNKELFLQRGTTC